MRHPRPFVVLGLLGASLLAACSPAASSPTPVVLPTTPPVQVAAAPPYNGPAAVPAAEDAQTPAELCAAALPAADPATRDYAEAGQVLEPDTDYRAIFCTEAGAVYVDLLEAQTPLTVNNFVFLAQNGYYNNTTFHRVLPNFMAQGGDPTATGRGGPNYRFNDEFVSFLTFGAAGKLAMANAGPNTNGSQFFITTAPTPHLNGRHTIFGQVIRGQANVENIRLRDPETDTAPGAALNTVLIITDPASVRVAEAAPFTQEEVVAALDQVDEIITPDVVEMLSNSKLNQTTAEVLAAAPEAAREALEALYTENDHEYRVGSRVTNIACNLDNIQFASMAYTLDVFATAEGAAAAIQSEALAEAAAADGFNEQEQSPNLTYPLFIQSGTTCDAPTVRAMTYYQRGRFIVTTEITVPEEARAAGVLDRLLTEFVGAQVYEGYLSSILNRDIQ